jgi:hypothetical protein
MSISCVSVASQIPPSKLSVKNPPRPSHNFRHKRLLKLLNTEFGDGRQACALFEEFLQQETYNQSFCLRLISLAKGRGVAWEIRRLAILMLENQLLRIDPANLSDFDFMLTRLKLKEPGSQRPVVSSVLKEGYSTTDSRRFVSEFRRRLKRLNRVHNAIGMRTARGVRDFIEVSRCENKLSLARYLFAPKEIVARILEQVQVTRGIEDSDPSRPSFIDDQIAHTLTVLPELEAEVLKRLLATSKVFWVAEKTSSKINSLVEYPEKTVVLVVKPPGSDVEFEFKRAGKRGDKILNVVFARNGYTVPPSHRFDGGSMQYTLQGEVEDAARFALIYRLVHQAEPPLPYYMARTMINVVPVRGKAVPISSYFTKPKIFGQGYPEMRLAMNESIEAFRSEQYEVMQDAPGDLHRTAQFLRVVAPSQAVLCGTSSFRLDKLAGYLSDKGPRLYFRNGLGVSYKKEDSRRLADNLLEEMLGCYKPPDVDYQNHGQYVAAAFAVAENRANADRNYLSLVAQIARFWGTLLAVRGYSRGESVVARNVGLKSCWEGGDWRIKIIFMDHDALVIPGKETEDFHVYTVLPGMTMDERYLFGGPRPDLFATSALGYIQSIFRVGADLDAKGKVLASKERKSAYKKTQRELLTNKNLRALFKEGFLDKLLVWDTLVKFYLKVKPGTAVDPKWGEDMKKMLSEKGYGERAFDCYLEIIEAHRGFLERHGNLYDLKSRDMRN